ncbi:MAG: hypothetical protein KDD37_03935 [Bdellovibrionales bacterium]|nr:hypothetical protein [Bdellovibrionales bacterium]
MKMLIVLLSISFSKFAFAASYASVESTTDSTTAPIKAKAEESSAEIRQATAAGEKIAAEIKTQISTCVTSISKFNFDTGTCPQADCISAVSSALTKYEPQMVQISNSCNKLGLANKIGCEGNTYMPIATFITSMVQSSSGSGNGNMYKKCKSAAMLQTGMGAVGTAMAATCQFTREKCIQSCEAANSAVLQIDAELEAAMQTLRGLPTACQPQVNILNAQMKRANRIVLESVPAKLEYCEASQINTMMALANVTQMLQGVAQSQSCQKELAQGDCMKPEAVNNPACTAAYCSNQANRSAPQCAAMFGECYSANAGANPRCACLQNPMQQSCLNLPSIDTNTANRATASSNTDGYNFDEDDIYGAQGDDIGFGDPNSKAPGVVGGGQQGGAGGGAGQGSALGGGPGGGGNGAQKGVYDTNVTGGTSAGAVGGGGAGGIAGYGSNAGNGGGYGNGIAGSGLAGSKNSLDLKKYLPGGQFAKQREDANTGITPANGLTNFQKVNRAHNNSRTKLVTP